MLRKLIGTLILPCLFVAFPFLPSCSNSHNQALRHDLSGRGLLELDVANPYLAPNMFLSEETKHSETLKGFLSLKGAPDFLEFSDPIFGRPALTLVYKSKNETFTLEEHSKDWIIRSSKNNLETENLNNQESNNNISKPILEQSSTTPPLLPIPISSDSSTSENNTVTKTMLPQESEEKTISSSRPTFKDIYHNVNFIGQTMSFLAYYYTGNVLNGERILRINASLQENLRIGDIVRIPTYLSQKDTPPSEDDLKKFLDGR